MQSSWSGVSFNSNDTHRRNLVRNSAGVGVDSTMGITSEVNGV
jgi:hypothetical protein